MPEFEDEQVGALLHNVGDAVSAHLRPPGPEAVFATVKRRRRNRTVATSALAIAMIAGPLVGYGLATDRGPRLPEPAVSTSVRVSVSPSTPQSSPTGTPSTGPSAAGPGAADGPITTQDLRDATVSLGPWPKGERCAREVTLDNGRAGGAGTTRIDLVGDVAKVGIGGDATVGVALFSCNTKRPAFQVMSFKRDAAGGIVSIGQVVRSRGDSGDGSAEFEYIHEVAVEGGVLVVRVDRYHVCCGALPELSRPSPVHYFWAGSKFERGDGSSLPVHPYVTDLRVYAGPFTMSKQIDGTWKGHFSFTVENGGASDATRAMVGLKVSGGLAGASLKWANVKGETCAAVAALEENRVYGPCQVSGKIKAGGEVGPTLYFESPTKPSGTVELTVEHSRRGQVAYPDEVPDNNRTTVPVKTN